jgi:multiple sugar transport system permease protein
VTTESQAAGNGAIGDSSLPEAAAAIVVADSISGDSAAAAVPAERVLPPLPKRRSSVADREARWGLFFLTPWLIGLVVFTAIPIIASLVLSMTNYNLLRGSETKFIGLDNYAQIWRELWGGGLFGRSLGVTIRFAFMSVPLMIAFGLGLAMLLNQKLLAGKAVFRTLFYMPVQIPIVASTIVWGGFLNGQSGWLVLFLRAVGIPVGNFLAEPAFALPGLVLMGSWGIGNMMLIFLAGLQSIPTELYEAVRVDGGGGWARFRHVTLPMISPVLFYNLLISFIGVSQYFTQAYVIDPTGNGNPAGETLFYTMNVYTEGWKYDHMGYASALAWVMLVMVLAASIALFRTSGRWVFYSGEHR